MPDEDIVLDYAGRRTYDSCYRARHIFGVDAAVLVTQAYHLDRALFTANRLVLYERELTLEGIQPRGGECLEEFATRTLLELLTVGKIDVTTELAASFAGDRRVLEDIRLLAESGYGEDDFGNNLPLPEKLAYLRK